MKYPLAILAHLFLTNTALAELQIQEPEVEAGEVEFQFVNGWASGAPNGDDLEFTRQSYEGEIQLGLTDYLMLEAGIGIERTTEIQDGENHSSNLRLTELELGIQLEVLNVDQHGLGLALVAGFTKAQTAEENDSVNWGAITKLAYGPFSITANTYFSDPRTDDANIDHVNFEYGVQLRYQLSELIALATEATGEIDNVYRPGNTQSQPHRLGPLIYLTWQRTEEASENVGEEEGPEVSLGLGAVFGLTDATPGTTIKADLELAF